MTKEMSPDSCGRKVWGKGVFAVIQRYHISGQKLVRGDALSLAVQISYV